MAVSFGDWWESHTGTTGSTSQASFTWNHVPIASPVKGILVFTFVNADADNTTSVTYGGVAMTAVTGGYAHGSTGEAGSTKAYFLGSSVPAGTQAVVVNRTNNANVMYGFSIDVGAGADTEVYSAGIVLLQTVGTLAVQSVDDGSTGVNSMRFAAVNSGLSSIPAAGTGSTALGGIDFGTRVIGVVRETTAGQGARNVGFSDATSDDRYAVHLAVREVASSAITGTGAVSFGFSESATAKETFTGTGSESFAFSESGTAKQTFAATGGASFGFSEAATAKETFSASGSESFGFALAAAGKETFTGSGAESFAFSLSGTGTVTSSGFVGTGAVSFGFAPAVTAKQTFTGATSESFTFSLAGTGTTLGGAVTGSGDVSWGYSIAGSGAIPQSSRPAFVPEPLVPMPFFAPHGIDPVVPLVVVELAGFVPAAPEPIPDVPVPAPEPAPAVPPFIQEEG